MRVRETALTLVEHIRYAQMLAIDQEKAVRVVLSREQPGYQVEVADDPGKQRVSRG